MSEWIEWKGGECPVSGETEIVAKYKDGQMEVCPARAFRWDWKYNGTGGDIVAYRLATTVTDEQTDDFQGSALIKQAVMA